VLKILPLFPVLLSLWGSDPSDSNYQHTLHLLAHLLIYQRDFFAVCLDLRGSEAEGSDAVSGLSLCWGFCCFCREGSGEGEEGRDQAHREHDEPAGHLLQASQRPSQEGVRALRALRRRDRPHHLLKPRPPLRVLQQQVSEFFTIFCATCVASRTHLTYIHEKK
jgi:hypothetical protein